jgi:outer membrane protein
MKRRFRFAPVLLTAGVLALPLLAQSPQKLTLAEADAIAIKNRPRLLASESQALAAGKFTSEVRSAYFPKVFGSATGADAQNATRIAAGQLNNPSVFERYANGITADQLITDFGRTGNLVKSAKFSAKSEQENATATSESVLLEVHEAYYGALQAQEVLRVAQQDVQERQVVSNQVTELAKNKLKSELDVSFANINLAQAKLLLVQAENNVQSSFANLSFALGYPKSQTFQLVDELMPPAPEANLSQLVQQALAERPEIAGEQYQLNSALAFEKAERDLWMPSLGAIGTAGLTPVREDPLISHYAAVGFNLNIPIFDGRLFSARRAVAKYQADATSQNLRELQDKVAHDVQVAWLNANTAYQRLDLTQQLQQEAALALKLAQARYNLGLSSIVELSQAQLNETQAEIDQASAKYQFQISTDVLHYQQGALR